MQTICLYSSYSESNKIVYYIKVYLTELLRHVDRIVFITNQKELDDESLKWLDSNKIDWDVESQQWMIGNETYRPDFFIYENGILKKIIEVKGYFKNKFLLKQISKS